MEQGKNLLSISEAAEFLDVSINTLRLWDSSGKLKALRSSGGHRYYSKEQLERFVLNIESIARVWAESPTAPELSPDQYCQTQDVFRARLDTMSVILDRDSNIKNIAPLIIAVTGEIGNNSFDHNFGNWPDVPGVFFGYNTDKRIIVLADRGLGIRATLLRVRPEIKDDINALTVAFTERISGRAPEQRGNGLKFVRDIAVKYPIGVSLQSGAAIAAIAKDGGQLKIKLAERNMRGTLAKIIY
ncbi:MAG: MerR family DNA-binding transcriptional regulator [Candidatus Nealsonbacteria bacterium]|nr:MerR family DNA-binding transcriptional regulator [Candidatus Nealsonbacteria bacterium]